MTRQEDEHNLFKLSLGVTVVLVLLLISGVASVYSVPKGHVGVKFSKLTEFDYQEKGQGWGLKIPFVESVTDISKQTRTLELTGETALTPKDKNGVNFNQEIVVRYRLDETQIVEFYELKGASPEAVVYTALRGASRNVLGLYAQEDVPEHRAEIADKIKTALQARLDSEMSGRLQPNYIIVEAVDVRNTQYSPRIEEAIINKQQRQQEEQRMVYELQISQKEREIAIVRASAVRNATILEAEGRAQAILVEASARAEGIQKVNNAYQRMPKEYVEVKYAEALQEIGKAGNTVVMDFSRFSDGNSNIGLLDYNKMIPALKTTQVTE